MCLFDSKSTKAAATSGGNFSKGFYMLGTPGVDLQEPLVTPGGTAVRDSDLPPGVGSVSLAVRYEATKGGPSIFQFFGNYVPVRRGQCIEMSCWIKFVDFVPPRSDRCPAHARATSECLTTPLGERAQVRLQAKLPSVGGQRLAGDL
jgi:hypothetical protein